MAEIAKQDLEKAAVCGEPSYVWRDGQERRLQMILDAAGARTAGCVLDNGCGIGMYVRHLSTVSGTICGLEYDLARASEAHRHSPHILSAAGENLPFPAETFDFILSHEVLEHVQDDRLAVCEMVRTLKAGGRIGVFVPNRGYPFETHGIYWKGSYHFGNIPLVNYLPLRFRNRLAPHVRIYTRGTLKQLFAGLPIQFIKCTIIFGAYDNIIARFPRLGPILRAVLHFLEKTPLRIFGLSHFWVIEKLQADTPR